MTLPLQSDLEDRFSLIDMLSFEGDGSLMSSYWVAEVEYESWADELRLCGGDGTLIRPSESLVAGARGIE